MCKLQCYKYSWSVKSEETTQKTQEKGVWQFASILIFWKISSSLVFNSSLISCSFLVHFEWFKMRWVCQLRFYKTCLYSKGKDCNDQRSQARNPDLFLFTYYQTLNPLTPNTSYLAHSFIKFTKKKLLTNVLWVSESKEQCVRIWSWLTS